MDRLLLDRHGLPIGGIVDQSHAGLVPAADRHDSPHRSLANSIETHAVVFPPGVRCALYLCPWQGATLAERKNEQKRESGQVIAWERFGPLLNK